MSFPLEIPEQLRRTIPSGAVVLLGISGGVDSAVALAMLQAMGCEVLCVTFKNFCYGSTGIDLAEKSCCSLEAIEDARNLALRFGAHHWVSDVEAPFQQLVIDPFIREYAEARTPNPCLNCNSDVRFPALVKLAQQQGCQFVATGHYARMENRPDIPSESLLLKGLDEGKDQSYFLHRIDRQLFPQIIFPLGWYIKDQIRDAARELKLSVADKQDSQEICFVPDDDRSFLFEDSAARETGDIVDRTGKVLGQHRGLIHYTVGQRRGMGVAAEHPLYVLKLDLENRRLIVGAKHELAVSEIVVDSFIESVSDFPDRCPEGQNLTARIRHRHAGSPVKSWVRTNDQITIELTGNVDGAAPGQGLVLYNDDVVWGGGRIISAR